MIQIIFRVIFGFFSLLFIVSFIKERRSFRNAIYLALCIISFIFLIVFSNMSSLLNIVIAVALFFFLPLCLLFVSFVFISAGIKSIKIDGFSIANSLSIVFGIGIWVTFGAAFLIFSNRSLTKLEFGLLILILLIAAYIIFTFTSLFIYSQLYKIFPKNEKCDFIIVHGAGLIDGKRVSPLLAGRLDKGIEVFEYSGRKAKLIVSGGKGSDESLSEAQAMKNYLLEHGISESSIIMEDRSTTTMENMKYSKKIMDGIKNKYRCIYVTNDYHVFRAGTYARKIGLKADGIGCKTAFYYWPNAFIREYIAIITEYKKLPLFVLFLWAIGMVLFLK